MTGKRYDYDAIIIGAGPNGLAAAIRLASDGLTVKVFEAGTSVGGGTRTEELIRTGYFHDICSAIHPMALASPYLKSLPLQKYGLEWITPPYAAVHPLDNEADRKSTRLNSSHVAISYAVFCLQKKIMLI